MYSDESRVADYEFIENDSDDPMMSPHIDTSYYNLYSTSGGGSMVGAIRGSAQREPLVVGKPSTFMMDYLANEFGILKSQICMVGDRLDTDILFGQNGGCKTLFVLAGNYTKVRIFVISASES
ncbi:unnamed protein product [Prunus brigantina]